MERMQSMFNNAFNTKAGSLVEKATSANLAAEDWALNMEICDVISSYEDGPKDAVKAIKRRLTNNKNQTQIIYTLTVLETCVKNCSGRLHVLVTNEEFCRDVLLKLFQGKTPVSLPLQNKVLGLIQDWAEAFKSNPAMRGIVDVYEELKQRGWEFPQPDKASAAPIITPKRSVPETQPQPRHPIYNQPVQGPGTHAAARPSTGPITPSQEQIAKLHSELEIVNGNVQVMSEMLTELNPGSDPSDIDLLQELNRTCRAMQQRVMELIERVSNEELTVTLLKVNDDMNNVFLRYERFERFRTSQPAKPEIPPVVPPSIPDSYSSPRPVEPPPSYAETEQPTPAVNDLIDLAGFSGPAEGTLAPAQASQPIVPPVTNDFAGLSLDPLMPSATSAPYPTVYPQFESSTPISVGTGVQNTAAVHAAEIEGWLKASSPETPSTMPQPSGGAEVTDEFAAFLSERAAVSDQLPAMPEVPTTTPNQTAQEPSDPRQRQMQTGNQPMFGL